MLGKKRFCLLTPYTFSCSIFIISLIQKLHFYNTLVLSIHQKWTVIKFEKKGGVILYWHHPGECICCDYIIVMTIKRHIVLPYMDWHSQMNLSLKIAQMNATFRYITVQPHAYMTLQQCCNTKIPFKVQRPHWALWHSLY